MWTGESEIWVAQGHGLLLMHGWLIKAEESVLV